MNHFKHLQLCSSIHWKEHTRHLICRNVQSSTIPYKLSWLGNNSNNNKKVILNHSKSLMHPIYWVSKVFAHFYTISGQRITELFSCHFTFFAYKYKGQGKYKIKNKRKKVASKNYIKCCSNGEWEKETKNNQQKMH